MKSLEKYIRTLLKERVTRLREVRAAENYVSGDSHLWTIGKELVEKFPLCHNQ